ncbi:hypothetical protein [Allorhodopirellula heiligendammensis]|uniref:Uncharacterized protein n=1 Tax=Allorhodopirellula heiligendammensis TaxID=2714739 RepID=A0A5C6B2D7_9BACT|nr:hypothetical protein [Allorhodopirellula heiligendammensis]TWU05396.1 hypothetical protein Poly21_56930 [Allorhodopirellula heiligendammensis]
MTHRTAATPDVDFMRFVSLLGGWLSLASSTLAAGVYGERCCPATEADYVSGEGTESQSNNVWDHVVAAKDVPLQ